MKNTVKIFLLFTLLFHISIAQEKRVTINIPGGESKLNEIKSVENISIIKTEESFKQVTLEKAFYDFQLSAKNKKEISIIPKLEIISSFRSNIRFGGFWNNCTVINFTPEMHLNPADFISIYAIHNMTYYVPVDRIRQNIKSIALRSAAIMFVDNSVKLFLHAGKIIGPLVSFLAKNLLIYTINETQKNDDKQNNLLNFDYNYYSVSIRF
jgi:hypothetical protein